MRERSLLVAVALLPACTSASPSRPAPNTDAPAPTVQVAAVPPRGDGEAPLVAQLVVRTIPSQTLDPAKVVLVEGDVSDEALRGFSAGAPPESTKARVVAATVFRDDEAVVIAPTSPLEADRPYTVVVAELSSRSSIVARDAREPALHRVWPPADGRAKIAILCGESPLPDGVRWTGHEPAGADVRVDLGVPGDEDARCVTVSAGGPTWTPPPALVVDGSVVAFLDAAPPSEPAPASSGAECDAGDAELGPACVSVDDDRIVVRTAGSPSFVTIRIDGVAAHRITDGDAIVLRGLAPLTPHHLDGVFVDATGGTIEASLDVTTAAAHPHVVVNEAMLAPLGDPARAQWIELVNDGREPVDLGSFAIQSGHDRTFLEPRSIEPGGFAVLVPEAFAPAPGDPPIAASASILTTPAFGANGLGTTDDVVLLGPRGDVASRLPASIHVPHGASICRISPDAPDDALASFAPPKDGVPTPGAPNGLEP